MELLLVSDPDRKFASVLVRACTLEVDQVVCHAFALSYFSAAVDLRLFH